MKLSMMVSHAGGLLGIAALAILMGVTGLTAAGAL